jgi:hypothetical protein
LCKPWVAENSAVHLDSRASVPAESMSGPVAVVCYICGRQYGTRSIDIHQVL